MRSKLKFLLGYYAWWMAVFVLLRLVFLAYNYEKAGDAPSSTLLLTFWHGARMDASMAAYLLIPVGVFVILSLWIRFFNRPLIYHLYTYILLFLVSLLALCDLEVFRQWGYRIDTTPLVFLATPKEAFASISELPLIPIFLAFAGVYLLLALTARLMLRNCFYGPQRTYKAFTFLALLLVLGALIIPIRGGWQQAPLNQSSVYFSTSNFANQVAVNAPWNFMRSLLKIRENTVNSYDYFTDKEAEMLVDSLYNTRVPPDEAHISAGIPGLSAGTPLVRFPADTPTNVLVIIWESFTEKAIHARIKGQEVTPEFNRLMKEGVYFSNVYASGDRTNKGISAILSGYPAMPNTSIVNSPAKSGRIEILSRLFREKGYRAPFFYGGEPEFANIKSYLLQGGFDPLIGKDDFAKKDMNSKWGAHDGVVMERVFDSLDRSTQPFFAVWLTLSSHEPFETPVPATFKGSDVTTLFLNSIHYTDQCVAALVGKCSRQPWWKHTVVIITGDHGHPLPATSNRADDFRIPMLWLGGALAQKGIVIDKIASQLDIAATLAKLSEGSSAKLSEELSENPPGELPEEKKMPFPFSRDILDTTLQPWAFFSFNNGFGFINASGRLVFDNIGKRPILREGSPGVREIEAGKAMQQYTYGDFLKE